MGQFKVYVEHRGTMRLIGGSTVTAADLERLGPAAIRKGIEADLSAAVARTIVEWAQNGAEIKVSPVE